jgi:hypothetical protein
VLKHSSSLRLIVPDTEKYIREYCAEDSTFFDDLKYLGGTVSPLRTRIEVINQMFRMGGDHLFAWDFETLKLYLEDAGFSQIQKSGCGEVPDELNIDGTEWWREHESLYVNALKM